MEIFYDFLRAIISGFNNWGNFNGRATRSEFWYFQLFAWLLGVVVAIILGIISGMIAHTAAETGTGPISSGMFGLGSGVVSISIVVVAIIYVCAALSLCARRLHDIDRSGWWLLLCLLPYVHYLMLIAFVWPGTKGYNDYGTDPLQDELN